jgi:hypothetical protein
MSTPAEIRALSDRLAQDIHETLKAELVLQTRRDKVALLIAAAQASGTLELAAQLAEFNEMFRRRFSL